MIPTHSRAPWGPWSTPNLLEFKGVEPPESSGATASQNQLEHHSGHVSHYVGRNIKNSLEQYYFIIVLVSFTL